MKIKTKTVSTINFIIHCLYWFLGLLFLLFNAFGLWKPWHLLGFSFFLFIPIVIISSICTIIVLADKYEKKLLINNFIYLGISIAVGVFSVLVSAGWFW